MSRLFESRKLCGNKYTCDEDVIIDSARFDFNVVAYLMEDDIREAIQNSFEEYNITSEQEFVNKYIELHAGEFTNKAFWQLFIVPAH